MQATTTRPKITAAADGEGVVSHAGSRLLADVADRTTLTAELGEVLGGLRKARARHDPGRVLVDMAVAVADGATTISEDRGVGGSGGVVRVGGVGLDVLAVARPARQPTVGCGRLGPGRGPEIVWAQRGEVSGNRFRRRGRPAATCPGW